MLGAAPRATAFLLHDLARKGWLRRLERGKYLILPLEAGMSGRYTEHEFIIAASLVTPYYIGFWTALNHYGYTEQFSATTFVAIPTRKPPRADWRRNLSIHQSGNLKRLRYFLLFKGCVHFFFLLSIPFPSAFTDLMVSSTYSLKVISPFKLR